jgi:hypothetical protein
MSADQPDHTKRRCASLDFQAAVTRCHGAVGDAAIAFDRTDDGWAPGYLSTGRPYAPAAGTGDREAIGQEVLKNAGPDHRRDDGAEPA